MSKAGKLIKGLVKTKKESVMGKLGDAPYEDPMDQWSVKYNQPIRNEETGDLAEDSWLFSYIRSLGYNPKIMDFAQRSKYARSNAFKHWKQSHMERRAGETATMEEKEQVDEAGTGLLMNFIKGKGLNPLSMDGNQKHAYSRSSEFKIFKQRHAKNMKETSGMGERGDDWNEEVKSKKTDVKEQVDKNDTVTMDIPLLIRMLEYAREDAKTDMDLHKVVENLINMRKGGVLSMDQYDSIIKINEDIEKIDELKKIPDNMDADDHITREEKKMKGPDPCWKGYQMVGTKKKGGRTVPNCVPEQVQEGLGNVEDSPLSATNSVKAMESSHRQKQLKSARIIKSLYKNKLKETLYDWEKDDKPKAKIVVQGGKTMTGQPRDTVEIDPILNTRPNHNKPTI